MASLPKKASRTQPRPRADKEFAICFNARVIFVHLRAKSHSMVSEAVWSCRAALLILILQLGAWSRAEHPARSSR